MDTKLKLVDLVAKVETEIFGNGNNYVATLKSGFRISTSKSEEYLWILVNEVLCPADSQHSTLTSHMENHIGEDEITQILKVA